MTVRPCRVASLLPIALLLHSAACAHPARPARRPLPERGVLAWIQATPAARDHVRRHASVIDVMSPALYDVVFERSSVRMTDGMTDGADRVRLRSRAPESFVRALRPGRPEWPLLLCGGSCAPAMSALLGEDTARRRHAAALAAMAKRGRWSGLVIDYEGLTVDAAAFTRFIELTAEYLHAAGRSLAVAVPPPCGRTTCAARSSYGLGALAHAADLVIVMLYDHTVTGDGPVAPRDWFADAIERIAAAVDVRHRDRVAIGLPLYGRTSLGDEVGNGVLHSHIRHKCLRARCFEILSSRFDDTTLSMRATIRDANGHTGVLSYENHISVRARLEELERHGFHRVALWRVGGEDPRIWKVLRVWRARAPATSQ